MQQKNRLHHTFQLGVKEFLQFAYARKEPHSKIPCPCMKCNNFCDYPREVVERHLLMHGIVKSYVRWIYHGEDFENNFANDEGVEENYEQGNEVDDMHGMIDDIATSRFGDHWGVGEESIEQSVHVNGGEVDTFLKLLNDAEQELYPGCKKFSKLSFLVKLLHLKMMYRMSNKCFDMLLEILKDVFPMCDSFPKSYYESKKVIRDLGLNYVKIDACVNDCAIFWKDYKDLDKCPKCGSSRWKFEGSKKIPQKVLRYFPLKPRLQRLFINKNIACDIRWHKDKRINEDNVLRHPADSDAWKDFDKKHELFAQDPRNVRLGLASDGFNPFGNMSNAYSIWPVFLVPYNLPPWKCMKDPFLMMSMIIPGPNSLGNDIDIFLQPLIDELKELWEDGFETYDGYTEEKFCLRAALLWTINDFPAYANLSGWSTKGYMACPVCMSETSSKYLPNGKKCCYMGHRRFLPTNHRWRKETKSFDGEKDFREPIEPLSGDDILKYLNAIDQVVFGKAPYLIREKKRKRRESDLNWTKKSIFFELPYWKTLKLRHNLDIMHVEKNVCDNVLGTLMNIDGKTKDNWKARKDLMAMGLRPELHLRFEGDKVLMPSACYQLSHDDEKRKICEFLTSIKFLDGFDSNIS